MKIDKRKKYRIVLDVETANSTEDALVYDIGFAVVDKKGNIYETHSLIIADIFLDEKELMKSAYYANKIPQYWTNIKNKSAKLTTLNNARKLIADTMDKYSIDTVYAYNAFFDMTALNTTERWLTKSKYRYFLPYGTKVNCIWHMACQTICSQKSYIKWCTKNNFISESGNIKTSAETVYAYLTGNEGFEEEHRGIEDTLIETYIMAYCFRQHKKMKQNINRLCWRIPQTIKKEIEMA